MLLCVCRVSRVDISYNWLTLGHCIQVNELWKAGAAKAYLVPGLIRFVSEEGPYLSNTNGGPRMFVNLEDHTSHTFKQPNTEFEVLS